MAHCMERAEVCLRTGQLRLAELYMRRALQETAGGRWYLECLAIRAAVKKAGKIFEPMLAVIAETLGETRTASRNDYALAE